MSDNYKFSSVDPYALRGGNSYHHIEVSPPSHNSGIHSHQNRALYPRRGAIDYTAASQMQTESRRLQPLRIFVDPPPPTRKEIRESRALRSRPDGATPLRLLNNGPFHLVLPARRRRLRCRDGSSILSRGDGLEAEQHRALLTSLSAPYNVSPIHFTLAWLYAHQVQAHNHSHRPRCREARHIWPDRATSIADLLQLHPTLRSPLRR
ncbi:hypothetical protein B0H10DRAFT_1126302 [Mycena sp. CBHHK59/15]|nr:hypothetical protein B0H10DRAFT_1126302 [Mycena sp. CBHHK59/15]